MIINCSIKTSVKILITYIYIRVIMRTLIMFPNWYMFINLYIIIFFTKLIKNTRDIIYRAWIFKL